MQVLRQQTFGVEDEPHTHIEGAGQLALPGVNVSSASSGTSNAAFEDDGWWAGSYLPQLVSMLSLQSQGRRLTSA